MNDWKIKVTRPPTKYYAKIWLELRDGGSDEWLWVAGRWTLGTYIFIRIIDLAAHMGREAPAAWNGDVRIVSMVNLAPSTIQDALRCCGIEDVMPYTPAGEPSSLALAEALADYGAAATVLSLSAGDPPKDPWDRPDEEGADFKTLRLKLRKRAEELFDPVAREEALDKVCNALGQTAREYMDGHEGLWRTLRRIRDAGDGATAAQKTMLKVYQAAGSTLGGPLPEDLRKS